MTGNVLSRKAGRQSKNSALKGSTPWVVWENRGMWGKRGSECIVEGEMEEAANKTGYRESWFYRVTNKNNILIRVLYVGFED